MLMGMSMGYALRLLIWFNSRPYYKILKNAPAFNPEKIQPVLLPPSVLFAPAYQDAPPVAVEREIDR
jgi:hypothetical protein